MAKLVLYSDQIIEANKQVDKELMKLFESKTPSIAYIPSCSDPTRKYFKQKVEYYKALGIDEVEYFDLDKEYDEKRRSEIFNFDAIHLSGGNTFYFLNLIKKRGFIELLQSYVQNGGILIGISAGSILMTNNIKVAGIGEDCDDNFIGIEDITALGLVDFEFSPHWSGNQEDLFLLGEYAQAEETTIYVCRDGSGIVVNGEEIKLIGDIEKIYKDKNK